MSNSHSLPATGRSPQALLEALDPDQRQVAEHLEGAMCVLAGAGTGKTRAITYRIAYGVAVGAYQPAQVLAVTFTQRAAGQMRLRLNALGVPLAQTRTFHSAALRQLVYFYPVAVGGQCPRIQESKLTLVSTSAARLGLPADRALMRDVAAEIEWAKVTMTRPEDYAQRAENNARVAPGGLELDTIARLYEVYETVKNESGVIDFEDVLLLMVALLRTRPDIAAQIRAQYKHFVVDEYQDVSPLQHRLLRLWLGERRSQLCVVGDAAQTIYSFTGASPQFLTNFSTEFPAARTLQLTRDYRSTPQVVSLANRVLKAGGSKRRGLPAGAVELISQRHAGPQPDFKTYGDDFAEAQGAVQQVQQLHSSGVSLSEIAILYRTSAQAPLLEQALGQGGFGCRVHGGKKFFDRAEVQQALRCLRAVVTTGRAELSGDLRQDARAVLAQAGWASQPATSSGAVRESWEALNAIVELADELSALPGMDLRGLLNELDERAQLQLAPDINAVTLSTIHAAKGLEWDAVIIVGVTDGLLPISMATGAQEIEEERRLLYVAITRARKYLLLSYAQARTGGAKANRQPSRFLKGMWPRAEIQEPTGSEPPARRKYSVAGFEASSDPQTLILFDQLRLWRSQIASQRSVPAYKIFPDATLRLIAIIKPQTLPQLAVIHGVGKTKLNVYGTSILQIVRGSMN